MFNFFSNNVIYVDGEQLEYVRHPPNEREEEKPVYIFNVPSHTVGTHNLIIFLDGRLAILDKDYEDYNSYQIKFKRPIYRSQEVVALLIKGNTQLEWGYFGIKEQE